MLEYNEIQNTAAPVILGVRQADLFTIIWRNFMQQEKDSNKASYLANEYIKQICPDAPMPYF